MASPLQRPSARRKLYYFGLILVLLTVTIFWRGIISPPVLASRTVESQAAQLDLREYDKGDTQLTGASVRLLLTGSRGLVLCGLWWSATEKQKRHEWNELELIVNSITTLQPHFLTPWLFQSWNMAYNVSVESDRLSDMYYYIARGIQITAEGERVNRNNPDLRYWIGFYYQNKFGVSDKVDTLRCLFQLSCIPPEERDAKRFLRGDRITDQNIDMDKFLTFCQKHPQLVRRMRESKVDCKRPADVVQFLADNFKIPNRFRNARELYVDGIEQFPTLPPKFYDNTEHNVPFRNELPDYDPSDGTDVIDDHFDGYLAAQAWFHYSLLPLPDPTGEPLGVIDPSTIPNNKRVPRQPATIVFRQGVPRAQSYHAERLQQEGWFDEEGWDVDAYQIGGDRWFASIDNPEPLAEGEANPKSKQAWKDAYELWSKHGELNGLKLSEADLLDYTRKASLLRDLGIITTLDGKPPAETPDQAADPEIHQAFEAFRRLDDYRVNQQITNYDYYLFESEAEQDDLAIEARKNFFEAKQLRQRFGNQTQAVEAYRQGFDLWQNVLEKYPEYHRKDNNQRVQDETYTMQLRYTQLLQELYGPRLREQVEQVQAQGFTALGSLAGNPLTGLGSLSLLSSLEPSLANALPLEFSGPFDGLAPDGKPWVSESTKQMVRQSFGIATPSPTPQPSAPPVPSR